MFVKKEHAGKLFQATSVKFAKRGIYNFTDMGFIDAFQEQLRIMARGSKYEEGERIKPKDLASLKGTVTKILEDMKNKQTDVLCDDVEREL